MRQQETRELRLMDAVRSCARGGLFSRSVAEEPFGAALALWASTHGVTSLRIAGCIVGTYWADYWFQLESPR